MLRCPLFIFKRPKPSAASGLPLPSSLMTRLMLSVVQASCIEQAAAPPCRLALVSASCTVLIRVGWRDSGMIAGSPLTANSVVTPAFCKSPLSAVSAIRLAKDRFQFAECVLISGHHQALHGQVFHRHLLSHPLLAVSFCHSRKSCSWTRRAVILCPTVSWISRAILFRS